ncbi:DUF6318 family protein [Glutamicibacter sp. M10]|uniref:DUF6318 family protein n=1 Tax=Glutamicibacter sp. M10 TaxID=3023076 RepID=UPI0021C78B86|nr:DUF6318 family protein [Glutamicibacter sp. M10]UXN30765.1 DUF6318 family protein [Glutamicibacter sp. M10]
MAQNRIHQDVGGEMRIREALLLASVVALTLCSCVSGPEDQQQPNGTTTSVRPSESSQTAKSSGPKPTPSYRPASASGPAVNVPTPKFPAEATRNSEKGAAAFVDYYFDLVNFVGETYDTKQIKLVTTRQCEVCGVGIIDPADLGNEIDAWQVGENTTIGLLILSDQLRSVQQ